MIQQSYEKRLLKSDFQKIEYLVMHSKKKNPHTTKLLIKLLCNYTQISDVRFKCKMTPISYSWLKENSEKRLIRLLMMSRKRMPFS